MSPGEPITFAGARLDRAGHLRTDATWQQAARANPAAKVVVVGREGTGETTGPVDEHAVFLGLEGQVPVFARPAARAAEPAPLAELREAAARLDPTVAGLHAYAGALLHWHRTHRFCGSCGQPTESAEAGHLRRCANAHTAHPRTDPVVIMLVADTPGDRLLLGRQPSWPAERYSTLAGFVEPGEPLEAAVAREVAEEAGITVADIRYVASQPWPFPANLMLGFTCEWSGGEAHVVDHELESVRWFDRAELEAAARADVGWEQEVATDGLLLPPRLAIARHLIDGWLALR